MTGDEIARTLRNWANEENIPREWEGVCGNLDAINLDSRVFTRLVFLMDTWPEKDGSYSSYPVGGRYEYLHGSKHGTLWENPRRKQLCLWLAEQIEQGTKCTTPATQTL